MSPTNAEIDAYFSDPINFPLAFKQWLVAYLEVNQPYLIVSQLSQKGSLTRAPGFIDMWGGPTAPAGTVMCDGASYLRVDGTHDALFTAIGTTYGAVDATHFNVPDIHDRVPLGAGGNSALGLTEGIVAANRHNTRHGHNPITDPGHGHGINDTDAFNHTPATGATGTGAGDRNLVRVNATTTDTTGITVGVGTDPQGGPSFVAINFVIWL